jgi:DNA-binding transcriptional LysR family regulator
MNLRFVEAFYWVASLKSISRAAEKLYLTQSAMSSRISTLEVDTLAGKAPRGPPLHGAGTGG